MGPLKIFFLVCLMLVVTTEARSQLNWRSRASTLLCNHPGSRSQKAVKIRQELHSIFPDWSWYVSVTDDNVTWTYFHEGSSEQWMHTCGYNMFIWSKEDSKIKRCSSADRSRVENMIRTADYQGYSESDIHKNISKLLIKSDIDYHLLYVDDGHLHSSHASHFSSVGCSVAKNGNHNVFVYIK